MSACVADSLSMSSDKNTVEIVSEDLAHKPNPITSVLSAQSNIFADEDHDITLTFIREYEKNGPTSMTVVDLNAVTKKIDKQMMLIMFLCYTCQFIDKVALNYANIMGLKKDLGLVGNQFSDLATYFFVGFLVFEPIQGFFIQKNSPTRVLAVNVMIWGVLCMCSSATSNFAGMLSVRVLLGCSEAAIAPCLVLITASWYTRGQAAFRTGIWYCGLGGGQIIGGLISFIFQQISPSAPFQGWKIMFLVVGFGNLLVGVAAYFYLPVNPVDCKFLTDDEKYALLTKLSEAKIGVQSKKFVKSQVWEALTDITLYLFFIIACTISFSSNTITTFSSVDILSFGFTSKQAALLNMPSGAVSIISTLLSTFFIMKGFPRGLSIMILCLPAVCGGALLSFLPKSNQAGLLVGIYMINTIVAPLAIVYAWVGNCVAGHTKKICFNVAVMFGFGLANILGPQSYRADDYPDYIPAKVSMLATQAATIGIAALINLVYFMRNKKRSKEAEKAIDEDVAAAYLNKTDFENRSFKYLY
ncbi:hypothetical protein KL929_005235 [Ogataea haglerorum]|uniref:Major facilitator superfamily (MFS) profile domain-containing protein n=1 Tax=Ogataea haglerorum TaxID=1937702 RepID=A0ABQ7R984_9ASCO|nr:hypothetical protein KL951_005226 [Ogataea haglerorum]KAG7713256.1 hypothetical protein KL913_005237 [Ogataea haglerorum]KAG7713462.1 hypothetical protein KL949_005211 [Ogataea haglerorum]KAG7724689.1 hypothetical protein KL948_005253 [Ogataea haglerorum]KAG7744715.1 hypothetical protein KL912_005225 [Ogataea haglerorum]